MLHVYRFLSSFIPTFILTAVLLATAFAPIIAQDLRNNMFPQRVAGYQPLSTKRVPEAIVQLEPELRPFYHGVASGDPLSDRVILWTRVTPEVGQNEVVVQWRVATDPTLQSVVRTGTATATSERDFTVKVDADGLQPGMVYYYGFIANGRASLTGRTRTAPARGASYNHARLAIVTCSNYPAGFFNAYARIADRNDLDAVVHLGDYIYEYSADTTQYGGQTGKRLGRMHEPSAEIVALADYRSRYAQYRLDPDLRRLHQQHPMIHVWDDHESANDAYMDGAENHTPSTEGEWAVRKAVSKRVHAEWMPIREQSPDNAQIYRSFQFGDLLLLMMLDTRLEGRMKQIDDVGSGASDASKQALNDPSRQLISTAQYQWLADSVASSTARWNVIGSQVLFSPVTSSPIDTAYLFSAVGAFAPLIRSQLPQLEAIFDLAFQGDVWNNYPAQRTAVANALHGVGKMRPSSSIVVSGDFHCGFAFDGQWPDGPRRIVEFMTPSISSANFDENLGGVPLLGTIAPQLIASVEVSLEKNNPFLAWQDIVNHGYLMLDLTPDRAQGDWFIVDTLYTVSSKESWVKGLSTIGDGLLSEQTQPAAGKSAQDEPAPTDPPIVSSVQDDMLPAVSEQSVVVVGFGPVPSHGSLYLSYASQAPGTLQYRLVSPMGAVVMQGSTAMFAGLNSMILDLHAVSSGAYSIVLESGTSIVSFPIVLQR
jgi:alkaline phosphatase D